MASKEAEEILGDLRALMEAEESTRPHAYRAHRFEGARTFCAERAKKAIDEATRYAQELEHEKLQQCADSALKVVEDLQALELDPATAGAEALGRCMFELAQAMHMREHGYGNE